VPEHTPPPDLARADARTLRLPASVAGILTSPPYPGVYDYDRWTTGLRGARGQSGDIAEEIGARRGFDGLLEQATDTWRRDTLAWTRSAAAALQPGGRMVIVIGDGPRPDGPIDTRAESIAAADAAGLVFVEGATAEPGSRPSPRREHALLFERPAGH
jgi:DNA modification methylase